VTTYKIHAGERQFWLSCAMRYAFVPLVLGVAACSHSGQPGGGGGDMSGVTSTDMSGDTSTDMSGDMSGLPSVSEVCQMVFGARQSARLACSGVTQSFPLIVYDAATCTRQQHAADAGYVTLDRAQVPPCLAAIQAASCDTLALGELPECKAIFVAQSAIGGACLDARDCKAGSTCQNTQCPGTCTKLAGMGEACGIGCAPPLVCSSNTTCQPPAVDGASCLDVDCAAGLWCNFNFGMKCEPRKPANSPCQTGTGACQPPLACNGSTCKPVPKLGDACGGVNGKCSFGLACDDATMKCVVWRDETGVCHAESECSPDFICTMPSGGNGTCVRWLESGATCDQTVYRCRPPTTCVAGTCTVTNACS
jgi:hypothetical protein